VIAPSVRAESAIQVVATIKEGMPMCSVTAWKEASLRYGWIAQYRAVPASLHGVSASASEYR